MRSCTGLRSRLSYFSITGVELRAPGARLPDHSNLRAPSTQLGARNLKVHCTCPLGCGATVGWFWNSSHFRAASSSCPWIMCE